MVINRSIASRGTPDAAHATQAPRAQSGLKGRIQFFFPQTGLTGRRDKKISFQYSVRIITAENTIAM